MKFNGGWVGMSGTRSLSRSLFWSAWWWHTEMEPLDSTVTEDGIRYISVASATSVLNKPRQELVNAMYSIWEEASADDKKDKNDKKLPDDKKWPEVFSVIDNVEVITQDEVWRLLSYFYPDKGSV